MKNIIILALLVFSLKPIRHPQPPALDPVPNPFVSDPVPGIPGFLGRVIPFPPIPVPIHPPVLE